MSIFISVTSTKMDCVVQLNAMNALKEALFVYLQVCARVCVLE